MLPDKNETIKKAFLDLLVNYTGNNNLSKELWVKIEISYSSPQRHYHTLVHLANLLAQLTEVKAEIKDWNTVLFTLYYHDFVYNPLNSDNEEKSAIVASTSMAQISVPDKIIEDCKKQIIATKSHIESNDSDTNYFTDADLSILGASWDIYSQYQKEVREEYSIYPDFVYNPGRKKVLNHFFSMDRIYKTTFFHDKFETQAKHNLQTELALL
jgi:predicted metal-dependent HD superfamily phosphohydrolase